MLTRDEMEREALAWLSEVKDMRLESMRLALAAESADFMASELRRLGGHSDKARLAEGMAERFRARKEAADGVREQAAAALESMENGPYAALLRAYYLDGKTWEQAADFAGYSASYAIRTVRHRAAAEAWGVMPDRYRG